MAITSPRASGFSQNPVPIDWWDVKEHLRKIAEALNNVLDGKINAIGTVTLDANQDTTTLSDRRIGANSKITLCPTTANAAAEVGAGTLYISATAKQSATISHANNAQADRTFGYAVLG